MHLQVGVNDLSAIIKNGDFQKRVKENMTYLCIVYEKLLCNVIT